MALRLPELIVIFVVALLVFGPKRLPEMGAQIGKSLNAFRKGMSEFNQDFNSTTTFTTQQSEQLQALEARRLELEILERELAVKRAQAALTEIEQSGTSTSQPFDESSVVDSSMTYAEEYHQSSAEEVIAEAQPMVEPISLTHTPSPVPAE